MDLVNSTKPERHRSGNWKGSENGGLDELSDDVVIKILSQMNVKEAARMSVLAHRWRYLWRFVNGTLKFDSWETTIAIADVRKKEKFLAWVNAVVKHHQGQCIEGMVIRSDMREKDFEHNGSSIACAVDDLVYFAMNKQVQRLKLMLLFTSMYPFPDLKKLLSSYSLGFGSPFYRLRDLRLVHVNVEDEVIHYFLASCPNLEKLHIDYSSITENIKVVDPPSLRVLYIRSCSKLQCLEISASIVSLTFGGEENSLVLKRVPNLCELTIDDGICISFVLQPKQHSSYSAQLEKLILDFRLVNRVYNIPIVASPDLPQLCSLKRLEVQVHTEGRQSLLFFTSLVNASPQLREFRIEGDVELPFPVISAANAMKFVHSNLKVVEIEGYVGCSVEEELLLELIKIGPLIESVAIHTKTGYYHLLKTRRPLPEIVATTRNEAKERARHFVSSFPKQIEAIVI
ncbi:F-box/FBD/LRR-repeat protein At3g26920-like isoform X2 [Salvia hispanica]|uniref:F-box/FBD/LRR-repeat protein At3g26920-like isoform X2 n=1 Tax=Salvia hispanica TaxID=49212 RepID=UPI002008F270|nr:F-box/FBD/LRR-repeat protein At3g26920-like isoform X2 [Salvia hispanica]